jgi:hypothetical protein
LKSNETNISEALEAFLSAHGLTEKLLETELRQRWEEIAGQTVAKYTRRFYVKKKIIYLEITVPVIKQEIVYSKSKLISNINSGLGKEFVTDIVLI